MEDQTTIQKEKFSPPPVLGGMIFSRPEECLSHLLAFALTDQGSKTIEECIKDCCPIGPGLKVYLHDFILVRARTYVDAYMSRRGGVYDFSDYKEYLTQQEGALWGNIISFFPFLGDSDN